MNLKANVALPISIGIIIILLALVTGSFYSYQNEHAKNIQLQGQINELNAKERITEGKLDEAKKQATEFQLKLQEAKAQVNTLTNELAQEKSARLEVSNKLDQISADLKQQKILRQDLEDRLNQSEADGKKIKDRIKVINQEKMDIEAKIKNLESGANGVELGKVVVNSDKAPVALAIGSQTTVLQPVALASGSQTTVLQPVNQQVKPLEAKVSVVNKEFNFAVINLGSKDGVKLGDEFSVSRSGKVIGNLKVEKVHEAMSAAGFAPELKDKIKENDVVQKVK